MEWGIIPIAIYRKYKWPLGIFLTEGDAAQKKPKFPGEVPKSEFYNGEEINSARDLQKF